MNNNVPQSFTTTAITMPNKFLITQDNFQCLTCGAIIKRYLVPSATFEAVEPGGNQYEIGGPRGLFHGEYPAFTALALAKASGNLFADEADVIEHWLEEGSNVRDNLAHIDILVKYRCHSYMTTDVAVQRRLSAYLTEIYNLITDYHEREEAYLREEYEKISTERINPLREG